MNQQIYCPQCGELNEIARNYCSNCGTKIKDFGIVSPQPAPIQQPAPVDIVQQQPRSSSSLWILCVICFTICCIPIISFIVYFVIVPMFR